MAGTSAKAVLKDKWHETKLSKKQIDTVSITYRQMKQELYRGWVSAYSREGKIFQYYSYTGGSKSPTHFFVPFT